MFYFKNSITKYPIFSSIPRLGLQVPYFSMRALLSKKVSICQDTPCRCMATWVGPKNAGGHPSHHPFQVCLGVPTSKWKFPKMRVSPKSSSGWWFGTFYIFPYIGFLIIPIDFHIFQRGSNHQPVILNRLFMDFRWQTKYFWVPQLMETIGNPNAKGSR